MLAPAQAWNEVSIKEWPSISFAHDAHLTVDVLSVPSNRCSHVDMLIPKHLLRGSLRAAGGLTRPSEAAGRAVPGRDGPALRRQPPNPQSVGERQPEHNVGDAWTAVSRASVWARRSLRWSRGPSSSSAWRIAEANQPPVAIGAPTRSAPSPVLPRAPPGDPGPDPGGPLEGREGERRPAIPPEPAQWLRGARNHLSAHRSLEFRIEVTA
jgi:hypothetical protein